MTKPLVGGHQRSEHPNYGIWAGMLTRCYNAKHNTFPRYGGRGITVCDRWRQDFAAFAEDMGPRPSTSHSIDRIDGTGNYEPGNCRWATNAEQVANKRAPRYRARKECEAVLHGLRELVSWMNRNEVGCTRLAALVGVSGPSASHWLSGFTTPDHASRLAIQIVTGIDAVLWLAPDERLRLAALRPFATSVAA